MIRIVNRMSDRPQRIALNVALETPRNFSCPLHRTFAECEQDAAG